MWINYALYEELEVEDIEKARQVYESCLKLIPHKSFTFAKIWLMYAHFEVRQKELKKARKILGNALGQCPKVCFPVYMSEFVCLFIEFSCRTNFTADTLTSRRSFANSIAVGFCMISFFCLALKTAQHG